MSNSGVVGWQLGTPAGVRGTNAESLIQPFLHSSSPTSGQLAAFVQGATSAAAGAIAGSVLVLAQRAIVDIPTALIGLVSLGLLWRFRLPEPLLVLIAGCVGLVLWSVSPRVHP
jgi:chromate transport protein ChrA